MNDKIDECRKIHSSSKETLRRSILLETMATLNRGQVNCAQCTGPCCTFQKNSMQITPLEALDLYFYLLDHGEMNDSLINLLRENINDFRLDIFLSTKNFSFLRKTYTCPFFGHKQLGCPFPANIKPYGCLGFNPEKENETNGSSCLSQKSILLEREKHDLNEEEINHEIRQTLDLTWSKGPIPVALLDVCEKMMR